MLSLSLPPSLTVLAIPPLLAMPAMPAAIPAIPAMHAIPAIPAMPVGLPSSLLASATSLQRWTYGLWGSPWRSCTGDDDRNRDRDRMRDRNRYRIVYYYLRYYIDRCTCVYI